MECPHSVLASSLFSSTSSQCQEEEHNIWNAVLGLCCHYHFGEHIALLKEKWEELLYHAGVRWISYATEVIIWKGHHRRNHWPCDLPHLYPLTQQAPLPCI